MIKIIKRLFGGLATALGYPLVDKQDFVDGFDIVDQVPKGQNKDGYNQPAPNTELAYDLGEVEEIEKKYHVSIDLVVGNAYVIDFELSIPGGWTYPLPVNHVIGANGTTTYTAIQAVITGVPALANTTFSNANLWASSLSFDIVFDDLLYTDYYFTIDPAEGSGTCVPVNDAISGEKAGALIPISFANVNFRQQVWSTTGNNEPDTTDGVLITGGQILASSVEYLRNEEVYIYGSGIQGAYWNLRLITPANYDIVAATDPGGTLRIPNGSYSVTRYRRTLSTIGQAINLNDPGTRTWEYTEWIRSINLNFRTYKQIQSEGKVSDNGMIFDWTDWLNPMKRMYYFGIQNIENGFLTHFNADALYNLDTVGSESILQLNQNTAKVKLSIATQDVLTKTILVQGAKPEASYAAFVRFITQDGGISTFSPASNVVWTHSDNLLSHTYGDPTSMSLRIDIEQIPSDVYQKAEVGIIEFGTDTFKGYLLPQVEINGSETLSIIDTGLDISVYTLFDPSSEVEQLAFYFENVRRIKDFDGYKIASNVTLPAPFDLSSWVEGLAAGVTVNTRTISIPTDYAANQQSQWLQYGYNNVANMSTEWTSYMPYDTVRLGVRVWWENGAAPTDFWIGDFSIDDAGVNPITNAANPVLINQYHLEITSIDLSTIVGPNGETVKDVVKDIRFTRTIINPKVIAQGIGIILAGAAAPYTVGYAYMNLAPDANSQPTRFAFYSPDLLNNGKAITFETGHEVYGYEATNQNALTVGANARAMDFYGNNASGVVNTTVTGVENLADGATGAVGDLTKATTNPSTVTNRGCVIVSLTVGLTYSLGDGVQNIYYVNPYSGGAYPNEPQKDRFFIIPQDQWFDKSTHTTSTVYKLFGGDCFGQKNYYKIGIDDETVQANRFNDIVGFYAYSRGNFQLRSGLFPSGGVTNVMYLTNFDTYTYDNCFTPKNPFQNYPAFNPLLRGFYQQIASLYYSQKAITQGYAGGNRIWLPLDTKALEIQYGGITGIEVLLGFSSNGLLLVWQEQRLTAQFFDNTANIKSNTGELLIGNGRILERKGVDYTNYGCSHPWSIQVGKNLAGHDTAYWYSNANKTFMRIGADGTTNIGLSLAGLLNTYMILADYQDYDYGHFNPYWPDTPAKNYGIHSTWNDVNKEYICSIRLIRNAIEYTPYPYKKGQWVMDSSVTWGFEQLPVLYKSLIGSNSEPLSDATAWQKYDYYNNDSMLFLTVVWNENANKWKSYRTYNPKIYGKFGNTYVSSHPTEPNLIYEHNSELNEALFYCTETDTGLAATTSPSTSQILCTGIGAAITGFSNTERKKYIVTINDKNYQITAVSTNALTMASVDADDTLPVATIDSLVYKICNSQDPYLTSVVNESNPRYVAFGNIATQADYPLKRVEFRSGIDSGTTTLTRSFLNYGEFEFTNGVQESEIKMDTTATPTDNNASEDYVQGYWCETKIIWRWGKENKLSNFEVIVSQTEKKK